MLANGKVDTSEKTYSATCVVRGVSLNVIELLVLIFAWAFSTIDNERYVVVESPFCKVGKGWVISKDGKEGLTISCTGTQVDGRVVA